MNTLLAVLMLAVAAQARPDAAGHVNIAEAVQQLNHTIVNAAHELHETLGLPTPDEALNLLTEQANAFKTKIAEVTTSLKQEAEKHQGSVAEQLNRFARNLNNSIHDAATSAQPADQLNSLQSALTNVGHQWQTSQPRPSVAQEAWAPVQSALQEAAEKTKEAAANLQNSIQSAVQKPAN
uniref:Apolipophorin-3b n=1 Tax=Locusta migratoria TaxID=7004 RepID=APL3_LOCMI|nr:RecName: Full=Apolipophorin-3b; AltName: Full=Apolipophorin-IIIb; Short=ApoLp-IIIb; Flags: Precursor [Locusta migratoria]